MNRLKAIVRWVLSRLYKIEVTGMENFDNAGDRVLIVANHTSYLDPPLLWAFLPGDVTFAINTHVAKAWWARPFLIFARVFIMDPGNPLSSKALINYLKEDRKAVIFPEGRITLTGALMKIYDGPGLVADKADAQVLPMRIDGAQYSLFSRLHGRVRRRLFPKVRLNILPARSIRPPQGVTGRARRRYAGRRLTDIMTEMVFATSNYHRTLFSALLDARSLHGGRHRVAVDIQRKPTSYNQLITKTLVLGRVFETITEHQERVGVLLPSSVTTLVVLLGLTAHGRVPAMLNFTAGAAGLVSACEIAEIKTVLTSRRFIEVGELDDVAARLIQSVNLVYMEDLAAGISWSEKVRGLMRCHYAGIWYKRRNTDRPNDPAVVLFTSGSEGTPKGVLLSHANLLANREQLATRYDFNAQDVILNALPLFHSFGLTAGTLLPLFCGMKTFFYPSPLHYRVVPEVAYEINATILFGTNTFLAGYGRHAHPYDFYSTRYVFAGAERLQDETRRIWASKFGLRIFEGYGTTETSPVLAANTPMENKEHTVGRLFPGIEHRLLPVPGITEGGRLHVRGPNIMLGYLLHDRPGELIPPTSELGEGWYDTGDIVCIDADGYITICGRAKRFAKIGGEMVSLAYVEDLAGIVWPEAEYAAVAVADEKKGEKVILITSQAGAKRADLVAAGRQQGIGEINIPRTVLAGQSVPLTGTGKVDYSAVAALVEQALAESPRIDKPKQKLRVHVTKQMSKPSV